MKIKILSVLALATFLMLGGCRSTNEANTANANMRTNTNMTAMTPMSTPVTQTNEVSTTDPAMKSKVEAALKAKGFNDVTLDTSTSPATLRGTVAKGKLAEAVAAAQEAAGKPVQNQITEK